MRRVLGSHLAAVARLAGHIDLHRDRVEPLLTLDEGDLIAALAGRTRQPSSACLVERWTGTR